MVSAQEEREEWGRGDGEGGAFHTPHKRTFLHSAFCLNQYTNQGLSDIACVKYGFDTLMTKLLRHVYLCGEH